MSDMRYEPGNWGDVLKGVWIEAIVRARATAMAAAGQEMRVLDGFAGHPTYPLSRGSRDRMAELGCVHPYVAAQAPYAARDLLASAATIARDTLRQVYGEEDAGEVCVFDLDPAKRARYAEAGGFRIAAIEDGFEILHGDHPDRQDLLVLDPYELIWRYEEMLPAIIAAAARADLLLYIFNKAPGSGGYRRNYTNFLHDLDRLRPEGDFLIGRVPSDGFLTQIYHEMLYLPAGERRGAGGQNAIAHEHALTAGLAITLRERTQELATHVETHHRHLRGRL